MYQQEWALPWHAGLSCFHGIDAYPPEIHTNSCSHTYTRTCRHAQDTFTCITTGPCGYFIQGNDGPTKLGQVHTRSAKLNKHRQTEHQDSFRTEQASPSAMLGYIHTLVLRERWQSKSCSMPFTPAIPSHTGSRQQ